MSEEERFPLLQKPQNKKRVAPRKVKEIQISTYTCVNRHCPLTHQKKMKYSHLVPNYKNLEDTSLTYIP